MLKDYQKWAEYQDQLQKDEIRVMFKEREVWWCSVGINLGMEMDGKNEDFVRPVLVLKKVGKFSFIGVPLTTKPRDAEWFFPLQVANKPAFAVLFQSRMFDSLRLVDRVQTIGIRTFAQIRERYRDMFI